MVDELEKEEGDARPGGGIGGILRRLFGRPPRKNLRKFERYRVDAPLTVSVKGTEIACSVANVSAGGVRIWPIVDADVGEMINITHTKTGLKLEGEIVGHDSDGTRVKFHSEEAGTIVSVWVRTLHSDG